MRIAKTVQAIGALENLLAAQIMNRDLPLTKAFCQQVMSQTQLSYHGRKPMAAVGPNGKIRKTNLDLLSLLADLNRRNARIELTAYNNALPWQAYAGEQHVGGTTRFGRITGLVSHTEHLSFSVRIKDESVLRSVDGQPCVGAQRTYTLADYTGSWHKGWHGFTWDMNTQERAYLERRNLLADGNLDCQDYVHHKRAQSVMGAPYLLLKTLHQRIENERLFFEREIKRLENLGVEKPVDLVTQPRYKIAVGASQSAAVPTFTMDLSGLAYSGEYTPVSNDDLGYRLAHRTSRFLLRELRPMVQFMVRADEVAFYRFGLEQDFTPHWIKGTSWEHSGASAARIALGDTLTLSYQKGVTEKKIAA
ncbi:MAG: hypothetical protein ACI9H6_000439 [Patiriisocius sp.]|jgi:hypothetical protein